MIQNMFQEGLYHVFVSEHLQPHAQATGSNLEDLKDARIVRWFGTVVNTRFLVTGVVQVLSSLSCILTTVSFICVRLGCSMSSTAPVWCGILYMATGGHAIYVQRKPNKVKVIVLMGLNLFCLLLGVTSLVTYSLRIAAEPSPLSQEQRIGAHVARGSAIFFIVQCVLASFYILFLSWRGLRRYSPPYMQAYYPVSQDQDDHMELILDNRDQSL